MAENAWRRWKKVLPELSGVTVATDQDAEKYRIGNEGLMHLDPARRACALKLFAWELVPADCDAIIYADLDVYPVCPMSPERALNGVEFACVRDRWDDPEVARVAGTVGIHPWEYFNAGLFYARRSASRMFPGARHFFDRLKWFDQTGLNIARVANDISTAWLPWRMNAMDRHDEGFALACSHAPHHAWPAWEADQHKEYLGLPDLETVIESLDFSHPYTTAASHLRVLGNLASLCRHVLEVGTFQGHAAWTMAAAGALVTTLDPAHEKSARLFRGPLSIDAFSCTGAEWIAANRCELYDLIFHDAEHGRHIIPELESLWDLVLPGGWLAVHDAEQLEGWNGSTLKPQCKAMSKIIDDRGRELMVLRK
jgi:hypothetical protein